MKEEKKYVLTKVGGIGKGPHILTGSDEAGDVVALCSCGFTQDTKGHCDGSHLKIEKEENDGCCGGGCCGGSK